MMDTITLGRTGITVNQVGFGALPIQKVDQEAAAELLRKAYRNGVNFYDTARMYTDSEEKIGYALADVRSQIVIATKTTATDVATFWTDLETSLQQLQTSYIDIYQFHNPENFPRPGDGSGLYEAMLEAREKGMIRHIGITSHRLPVALAAVESGLYETMQYPFSYLAVEREVELVRRCRQLEVGFIAMKALSGGLITQAAAAYAYMAQYDNVLPIWGIQWPEQLEEFLSYRADPPKLEGDLNEIIARDRQELSGEFCRGCGYCLPCPADIEIPIAARMILLLKRASEAVYLNEEWQEKMSHAADCTHCNHCLEHCPYGLDTPQLVADNWAEYQKLMK